MNIEIIKNPAGTFSVFVNGKLESDGWRTLKHAKVHARFILSK